MLWSRNKCFHTLWWVMSPQEKSWNHAQETTILSPPWDQNWSPNHLWGRLLTVFSASTDFLCWHWRTLTLPSVHSIIVEPTRTSFCHQGKVRWNVHEGFHRVTRWHHPHVNALSRKCCTPCARRCCNIPHITWTFNHEDVKAMVLEWFWQDPSMVPTSMSIFNGLYSFTQSIPETDFISTTVINMTKLNFAHSEFICLRSSQ